MHSRAALARIPLLLVPLSVSALVTFSVVENPSTQVVLLGLAFFCAVGTVVCWWLLALAWLATAR